MRLERMSKTSTRLASIIHKFRAQTIAVLGDFMLDELWRGETTRVSPEAPVPVVLMDHEHGVHGFPGGAGNVAANIAALGGRAVPFGAIGMDSSGDQLRQLLEDRGIACGTLVRERGRTTPRKLRIVARQHQLIRLDFEKPCPLSARALSALVSSFKRNSGKLSALVISDYLKGSATTELCGQVVLIARERGIPVFVDPKPGHSEVCRHATCITPNLHEAELLAGSQFTHEDQLVAAGQHLLKQLDCRHLLITRGGEGMTLLESPAAEGRAAKVHRIPGITRPVYDVTGAGDTVIAVLALAYAAGASMPEAAELANLAAGLVVLKFGTAVVASEELLEAARHP
jgi:rfaE bifunctional protein kinase chain/domain